MSVVAACHQMGLSMEDAARGICRFTGASRRFELTGTPCGVRCYHDYGHNPAEYRTVIPSAVRMARSLGGRSIIVSQPHTYSRTKALFDDYLTAFDGADIVLVSDIFAAREVDPGDIHSTQLVAALQNCGVNAIYLPGFDELEAWLRANWHENDVVLTLGCGNINLLNERLNA